jgi:hypothetical protein
MNNGFFSIWFRDFKHSFWAIFVSLILLTLAIMINVRASRYADSVASNSITDLLLDILPTIDLSWLFLWGMFFIITIYFAYPLVTNPNKLPFYLVSFSLLIIVRSFFLVLTHLRIPDDSVAFETEYFKSLFYQHDLFFSGHTAIPFLGFLVIDHKWIKGIMLIGSIIMPLTVLLMHRHYSIDVFAAYFITYGVYKISKKIFS